MCVETTISSAKRFRLTKKNMAVLIPWNGCCIDKPAKSVRKQIITQLLIKERNKKDSSLPLNRKFSSPLPLLVASSY